MGNFLTLISCRYILLNFITLKFCTSMYGQSIIKVKEPTIPIDTVIKLTVYRVDTTDLDCYNIYYFNYRDKKACFIIEKVKDQINLKTDSLFRLCIVRQFCSIDHKTNKITYERCASVWNNFDIDKPWDDDKTIIYDFNEFVEFPTLRICDKK